MDNDLNRRIAEALGQRVVMRAADDDLWIQVGAGSRRTLLAGMESAAHRAGRIAVGAGETIERVAVKQILKGE
jgi:hypothetical protein